MSFYDFSREDFLQVADDSQFIEGVRLAIENCYFPNKYLQPQELLEESNPYQRSLKALKYPLPQLSFVANPDEFFMNSNHYHWAIRDLKDRQDLIDKSIDKYEPAWYCYLHNCEDLAIFILFPLLKLIHPNQKFYLYKGNSHKVLLNKPLEEYRNIDLSSKKRSRDLNTPLVFDLVSQMLDLTFEWIFKNPSSLELSYSPWDPKLYIIEDDKMVKWYIENYGYQDMDEKPFLDWYSKF